MFNFSQMIKNLTAEGLNIVKFRIFSRIGMAKLWFARILRIKILRSIYGVYFVSNYGDNTFSMYIIGSYGKFYWDKLVSQDKEFVFLDIGANQGLYTIAAALNNKNIVTYAFEPVHSTFTLLGENVKLNGLAQKCRLVERAISNDCSQVGIHRKVGHSGAASLAEKNPVARDVQNIDIIETINGKALNSIVVERGLPILVKIDVEGHELTVIKELASVAFAKDISEIFYEVDEKWVDPFEIENELRKIGFNSFLRVGHDAHKAGKGAHYDVLAARL